MDRSPITALVHALADSPITAARAIRSRNGDAPDDDGAFPLTSACLHQRPASLGGGPALAADDAATICKAKAALSNAAVPTGDPAKMAAVFTPDGEVVTPWGLMAGRDAIIKYYASYMKAGDKQTDTFTSSRLIGDIALCTGTFSSRRPRATPTRAIGRKWRERRAASGRFSI